MAKWCRYCEGSYPYYCSLTGDKVMNDYYCKQDGYGCPIYYKYAPYHITSVTCHILDKKMNDKVYGNIRVLRDEYMEGNEEYKTVLREYDAFGPVLATKMQNDDSKEELATKVYSILDGISTFVKQEEIEKAVINYSRLMKVLIHRYDLDKEYSKKDSKKLLKTLDL